METSQRVRRLTQEEVAEIKRRYAAGETQVAIAAAFQVTQSTISRVVTRAAA